MRKSSSAAEASAWKTMIYLFDREILINGYLDHFECSSSDYLYVNMYMHLQSIDKLHKKLP